MDKTLLRRIVDKGAIFEIVDTDGNVVAVVPSGRMLKSMTNLAQWDAEAAEAWREARLIAAAPLMLRCVEQFSAAMHALGIDAELYDGIVAYVEGVKED